MLSMGITLLHLVIGQGVYRTDFCPRLTPLTHSLLEICPKSPLKLVDLFFGHFSGYMGQNLVYRSSTSQSYVPDAKYHLPKFGRQKVKFQFYFSLSLHSQPVFRYLFALILVG